MPLSKAVSFLSNQDRPVTGHLIFEIHNWGRLILVGIGWGQKLYCKFELISEAGASEVKPCRKIWTIGLIITIIKELVRVRFASAERQ